MDVVYLKGTEIGNDLFNDIGSIHKKQFATGLLSNFKVSIIASLYKQINKYGFLCIAVSDNEVIGFISGIISFKYIYRNFILRNTFYLIIFFLKKIFSIDIIKRCYEALFYPKKTEKLDFPNSELVSLVVKKNFRRKKIAETLFVELLNYFEQNNIRSFKIMVGSELSNSIKFYEKMGANIKQEINSLNNEKSYILTKEL